MFRQIRVQPCNQHNQPSELKCPQQRQIYPTLASKAHGPEPHFQEQCATPQAQADAWDERVRCEPKGEVALEIFKPPASGEKTRAFAISKMREIRGTRPRPSQQADPKNIVMQLPSLDLKQPNQPLDRETQR